MSVVLVGRVARPQAAGGSDAALDAARCDLYFYDRGWAAVVEDAMPMPQPPLIPNNRHNPLAGIAAASRAAIVLAPPRANSAPAKVAVSDPAGASTPWWSLSGASSALRNTNSFLVSLVVHCVLLIVLALIIPTSHEGRGGVALIVDVDGDAEAPTVPENLSVSIDQMEWETAPLMSAAPAQPQVAPAPDIASPFAAPAAVSPVSRPTEETQSIPSSSLLVKSSLPVGGGIEGRTQEKRSRLAGERGGTPASENAVELALVWLAQHQREDGSWCLKLEDSPCKGECSHSGMTESNTGATALALLPFLGAGYSHQAGPYQEVVRKGLYYLTTRMRETPNGGDLTENVTMYAHGLATIALCEGLAMTDDPHLRPFAQKAIDFICHAQHPRGGWRYFPGQPGDTTVTGWQVMALKSARLAKLTVPSQTTQLAGDFLDSVQQADGAFYGYQKPDKHAGSTAVALLLRMYSGWQRTDPRLIRGVTFLSHMGPSKTDVYFDYYATQVLHHHGGSNWNIWNTAMREHLVATQVKSGHERGSWFFPDKHGSIGGRLYTTAMCTMILEVYYRHLPLYGDEAVEDAF